MDRSSLDIGNLASQLSDRQKVRTVEGYRSDKISITVTRQRLVVLGRPDEDGGSKKSGARRHIFAVLQMVACGSRRFHLYVHARVPLS
jgi:hypothetical protein